jgi:hypothetical protein
MVKSSSKKVTILTNTYRTVPYVLILRKTIFHHFTTFVFLRARRSANLSGLSQKRSSSIIFLYIKR